MMPFLPPHSQYSFADAIVSSNAYCSPASAPLQQQVNKRTDGEEKGEVHAYDTMPGRRARAHRTVRPRHSMPSPYRHPRVDGKEEHEAQKISQSALASGDENAFIVRSEDREQLHNREVEDECADERLGSLSHAKAKDSFAYHQRSQYEANDVLDNQQARGSVSDAGVFSFPHTGAPTSIVRVHVTSDRFSACVPCRMRKIRCMPGDPMHGPQAGTCGTCIKRKKDCYWPDHGQNFRGAMVRKSMTAEQSVFGVVGHEESSATSSSGSTKSSTRSHKCGVIRSNDAAQGFHVVKSDDLVDEDAEGELEHGFLEPELEPKGYLSFENLTMAPLHQNTFSVPPGADVVRATVSGRYTSSSQSDATQEGSTLKVPGAHTWHGFPSSTPSRARKSFLHSFGRTISLPSGHSMLNASQVSPISSPTYSPTSVSSTAFATPLHTPDHVSMHQDPCSVFTTSGENMETNEAPDRSQITLDPMLTASLHQTSSASSHEPASSQDSFRSYPTLTPAMTLTLPTFEERMEQSPTEQNSNWFGHPSFHPIRVSGCGYLDPRATTAFYSAERQVHVHAAGATGLHSTLGTPVTSIDWSNSDFIPTSDAP